MKKEAARHRRLPEFFNNATKLPDANPTTSAYFFLGWLTVTLEASFLSPVLV